MENCQPKCDENSLNKYGLNITNNANSLFIIDQFSLIGIGPTKSVSVVIGQC